MYLTSEEEKILNGEFGESMQKAMEILVALGKIYDADRLIPIKSAHISGVSYYNIGDSGLEFLREFTKKVKVRVKTTINPCAMDLDKWNQMYINVEFASKQIEIIKIFNSLGIDTSLTCTPYLIDNKPSRGDHIAWSESSAVLYANSILGALTNRESGISALASAIIGKTPNYGMHIRMNRAPQILVKLNYSLVDESDYGILGYLIGKNVGNKIPWIEGIKEPSFMQIKILSASIGTYSGLSIYHIPGLTAEWKLYDKPREKIILDEKDFKEGREYMNDDFEEAELIWLGCPHLSLEEIKFISSLLKGKKVRKELWLTTSRAVYKKAFELGYIKIIEEAGGKVFRDTCLAVAPLKGRFKYMITNSAKACYYSRGLNKFKVKVLGLKDIINKVI